MNKRGFSLVVFLIYLCLTVIVVTCMYHTIVCIFLPSIRSIRMHKELIVLHIISDIFVREIRSSSIKKWKKVQDDCIIWNNGAEDILWRFHNNCLERIQGQYTKKESWKKKTRSIVGSNLQSATFSFENKKENIVGITLHMISKYHTQKKISSYVAIREQVV